MRACACVCVCVRTEEGLLRVELSALPTRYSLIAVDVRAWPENMAVKT